MGRGPGPLKVGSPTLVAGMFPDPIWVGAETLPVCPEIVGSKEVLAELPRMGTTIEDPETRIVEGLLPCGIVAPGEPRFETETGLENDGDTLEGLEDPNADINWVVPLLPGLGNCTGVDDCGMFEIELPLIIEPCVDVDRETVFFTVLPPRADPCGMVVSTEIPLAIEPGTDAGDCEALFVGKLPEGTDVFPSVK